MRVHYDRDELRREDLRADPVEQFTLWMKEACDSGLVEPNAMSLATVGADRQPGLRTVLLKGFDERGFVFYTNLESRKARQIAENAQVSLLFPWLALHRQVAINGVAERVPLSEALAYFVTRPFWQPDRSVGLAAESGGIDAGFAGNEMGGGEAQIPGGTGADAIVLGRLPRRPARPRVLAGSRPSVARPVPLHAAARRSLEDRAARAVR